MKQIQLPLPFILLILAFALQSASANLVSNPGFSSSFNTDWGFEETDPLDTWTIPNFNDRLQVQSSGGNPDFFVGMGPNTSGNDGSMYQPISVSQGLSGTIDFSFDLLNNTPNPENISWGIWGFNTGDTYFISTGRESFTGVGLPTPIATATEAPSANSGWTSLSRTVDLAAGGYDILVVGFGFDGANDPGSDVGVDNVSVIPEPSTYVLLLGLVSLGVVCLRRAAGKCS